MSTFDAEGRLLRTTRFEGGPATITRSDRGYALVYARPAPGALPAIRVRSIDHAMKLLWDKEILAGARFLPLLSPYRITRAPGGEFFVTGIDDGKLAVIRVASDGRIVWSETHHEKGATWQQARNAAVAGAESSAFALFSMLVVGPSGEQREIVRVTGLAAR